MQDCEHVVEGIHVKINRAGPRPEYQAGDERLLVRLSLELIYLISWADGQAC